MYPDLTQYQRNYCVSYAAIFLVSLSSSKRITNKKVMFRIKSFHVFTNSALISNIGIIFLNIYINDWALVSLFGTQILM